jgi:hypothetical protein
VPGHGRVDGKACRLQQQARVSTSEKDNHRVCDVPITSLHVILGTVDEWILKTSIERYGRSIRT